MEPWSTVAERWPHRILEVRRCCARDLGFYEIVSDYAEARSALERWRRVDPPSSARITDYEKLILELEAEIERDLSKRF